jgi:hypothetical protein
MRLRCSGHPQIFKLKKPLLTPYVLSAARTERLACGSDRSRHDFCQPKRERFWQLETLSISGYSVYK